MSRLLAISDIHGYSEQACLLLEAAGYNPGSDRLLLLGDYINQEPQSWQALDYIRELVAQGAVALAGNMERFLRLELGKQALPDERSSQAIRFLDSLPLYAVVDSWLFVHAGIRHGVPLELQREEDLIGIREEFWAVADSSLPYQVVFGHTPTKKLGAKPGELWHGPGMLGIDTGAKHGMRLTLVDLTGNTTYSCSTNFKEHSSAIRKLEWQAR